MSRNYTHTNVSRLSSNKRNKLGNIKFYTVIAIILILLVVLSRDVTPNYSATETDLTNQIKAGEFIK